MVISTIADIGTIVVAEFQRLVFTYWNRDGTTNSRISLHGTRIVHTVDTGSSPEPEVSV